MSKYAKPGAGSHVKNGAMLDRYQIRNKPNANSLNHKRRSYCIGSKSQEDIVPDSDDGSVPGQRTEAVR